MRLPPPKSIQKSLTQFGMNNLVCTYISDFISFVKDPTLKINIAVWDEVEGDNKILLARCTIDLPNEEVYDQKMTRGYIQLLDEKGEENAGKIQIGIQYIYDYVKYYDSLLNLRSEEYKSLSDNLRATQELLENTSCILKSVHTSRPF